MSHVDRPRLSRRERSHHRSIGLLMAMAGAAVALRSAFGLGWAPVLLLLARFR